MKSPKPHKANTQSGHGTFSGPDFVGTIILSVLFLLCQPDMTVAANGSSGIKAMTEKKGIASNTTAQTSDKAQERRTIETDSPGTAVTTGNTTAAYTSEKGKKKRRAKQKPVYDNTPFAVAEKMPLFMGEGINKFYKWINSNLKYPAIEPGSPKEGRVIVSFVVEKDGSTGRIKVLSSPNPAFSEEAIRVVGSSPKWTPGKQDGVPVAVIFNIPVNFRPR